MRVAIFGATGPTGQLAVKEALEKGYYVTALVRNPDKLATKDDKLQYGSQIAMVHSSSILQGFGSLTISTPPGLSHSKTGGNRTEQVEKVDIFKPEELSPHLKGCDAVVSCLGTHKQGFLGRSKVSFYTDSIESIVSAMRTSNTNRLVCLTSVGTEKAAGSPWYIEWIFRPLLIGNILSNMAEMEHYLVDHCSDLSYTVVRPAGLVDGPSSGKEIHTEESQHVTGASMSIPRADVGKFVMDCVQNQSWLQKIVAIGLK